MFEQLPRKLQCVIKNAYLSAERAGIQMSHKISKNEKLKVERTLDKF